MGEPVRGRLSVLIDPGHGGADPGAVCGGVREADVNLEVALALGARLFERRRPGGGAAITLTRYTDRTVSLAERVAIERAQVPTHLFVSIHANAAANPEAKGFEAWTSRGQTPADAAATEILAALDAGFPGRGVRADFTDGDPDREADFWVLRRTRAPAVLVELGFLTNEADRGFLADAGNRFALAAALEAGIWNWWRSVTSRGGEA